MNYNRPNKEISLALHAGAGRAEFQIVNDSEDLSAETQSHLFGRFVRRENAAGKVDGCGLGLNIAQWIVQAHEGRIELRAETGKTAVHVELPLASAPLPPGAGA